MEVSFTLSGNIPSKKNSKVMSFRSRRPILLSSERYLAWHTFATIELMKFKNLPKKIEKCKVAITFFPETLRSADLSNKTESIMDLLVDCGIIKDDNWFVCSELTLKLGQVDKQNPRAEVTITY